MAIRSLLLLLSPLLLGFALSSQLLQANGQTTATIANGAVVTGTVIAQGKPFGGAVLTLWQGFSEPTPNSFVVTAQSDTTGTYSINNVPPGNYFIMATAKGFVTGKENQTVLNIRPIVVAGRNPVGPINFELVPEGIIKGIVTDADGRPIANVPIVIFHEAFSPGDISPLYGRDLRTDERGTYRISGIPAGRYRIGAGYEPVTSATQFGRPGYRRVFFPESLDQSSAKLIEIKPGSEIADVNINLGRPIKTFTVRARILDDVSGTPVENINYSLEAFSDGKRIGGTSTRDRSNARGEVTIQNVPAGEYGLRVPGVTGSVPGGEIPPHPNFFGQSKHFNVGDADVSDIEVRVVKAASASGFVVVEGNADNDTLARVSQMRIVAMVKPKPGASTPIIRTNIKFDGSFSLTGLMPGTLNLNFSAPPSGPLPLRLVRVERNGVRVDQGLEIEAGDQITGLRVVLGYAKSSIHGVVKLNGQAVPPGVVGRVIILQNGVTVDGVSIDPQGEFILQHLTAGEYKLMVSARKGNEPVWTTEKIVTIPDNKQSEITINLEAAPNQSPNQ